LLWIEPLVDLHSIWLDLGILNGTDFSGRELWDICDDRRVSLASLVGRLSILRGLGRKVIRS